MAANTTPATVIALHGVSPRGEGPAKFHPLARMEDALLADEVMKEAFNRVVVDILHDVSKLNCVSGCHDLQALADTANCFRLGYKGQTFIKAWIVGNMFAIEFWFRGRKESVRIETRYMQKALGWYIRPCYRIYSVEPAEQAA